MEPVGEASMSLTTKEVTMKQEAIIAGIATLPSMRMVAKMKFLGECFITCLWTDYTCFNYTLRKEGLLWDSKGKLIRRLNKIC